MKLKLPEKSTTPLSILCFCLTLMLALFQPLNSSAQGTINTTVGSTNYTGSNGAGAGYAITFVVENNSGAGIYLTDLKNWYPAGYTGTVQLWYSSTSLSGSYGTLATPTWTQIGSGSMSSTVAGVTPITWSPALSFLIPNGTIYRFAVYSSAYCSYSGATPVPTPSTFTVGGVSLYAGDYQIASMNVGYGSTNNPRWFTGEISWVPAGPCTSPPTAGTTTASVTSACQSSTFNLGLTGNSGGTGQTYQWQTSTSSTGPWTNLGTSQSAAGYVATATSTLYYRCAVTCSGNTAYSTPVLVTVPGLFPGGTYTINSALPTAGTNFQSFTAAVNAISCGISGPVIFNVVTGSGPYTEQVSIPNIPTTSAVNTVTFNGNNQTLTYTNTSNSANYAVLRLDGADYFRFKKLNVVPGSTGSYGYGIVITNDADNNLIDSCTVDNGLTQSSSNFGGIIIGSATSATTGGNGGCDSNTISNNTVIGGYYATTSCGPSTGNQFNNKFINNLVRDYYVYGFYCNYNTSLLVENNEYHRLNRTSVSTFYGVYMSTGNLKSTISKNRIHNPFTGALTSTSSFYGIYHGSTATAGNENLVSNNIMYNLEGNGAQYVMYSAGAYVRWYHNTISNDYTAATAGSTYTCYIISTYAGVEYLNNNISLTRGGTGSKYIVYHSGTAYPAIHNRNNYYVSGTCNVGYYGGTTCATLANWQSTSSKDANSVSVNPNFVNASMGNLTPSNLAMDNIGTPVTGVTTDITGFVRSTSTPDAGAYEFNNCFPPTGLAAAGLTTSTANLSWLAAAGAIGYEYVVDQVPGDPSSGTLTTGLTYGATGLNNATTYYLHVRTKCSATTFSSWATIPFTTCTNAVINPAGLTTFCTGSVVLNSTGSGTVYQWKVGGNNIPGATQSSYTASTSGSYTILITNNANGCAVTSSPVVVTAGAAPAFVSPTPNTGYCQGSSVTLAAPSASGYTYQWKVNGNNIPGATTANYSANAVGNYTVTVTGTPATCTATSAPTAVTMYNLPVTTLTPAGNFSLCSGNSTTLSTPFTASQTYVWKRNGTVISGATTNTYSATLAGSYTVTVTNTATGCMDSTATPSVITIVPAPAAVTTPAVTTTSCDSLTLSANTGTNFTYQWKQNGINIPGATGQTYNAAATGSYQVIVNNGACVTTSSSVAVNINVSPLPVITYSSPLSFCDGGGVALNSYAGSGLTYVWKKNGVVIPGATTLTNVTGQSGSYTVTVTNTTTGCVATSAPVAVTVNPLPTPPIAVNNNILSTGVYNAYQWYYNSQPIFGSVGQTHTYTVDGAYNVAVTDANGCTGLSAVKYIKTSTGISNVSSGDDIHIFPNPAQDVVNIDAPQRVNVTVRDLSGRVVLTANDAKRLNLGTIADGVYMMTIADQQDQLLKIERLVKKQ